MFLELHDIFLFVRRLMENPDFCGISALGINSLE